MLQRTNAELKAIVQADSSAGKERTDRTRYLAANAALVLAESELTAFYDVKLVKPFKKNLTIAFAVICFSLPFPFVPKLGPHFVIEVFIMTTRAQLTAFGQALLVRHNR